MSIATEISRLQTAKSGLKTSIENKGVTVPSSAKLDNYADYVDAIQTGGSANIQSLSVTTNGTYTASGGVDGYSPVVVNVPSSGGGGSATDPVRFIDYDGTILHSYSAEDFANLSAMPANPSHTGLTAQGWNWTLSDAKSYVATYGMLDIGQMYITDNGATRIYISLVDSVALSPYLGICPNGRVSVNWGDNTAASSLIGSSLTTVKSVQHTYAATGNYVITLTVTNGTCAIYGSGSSQNGSYLLTRTSGNIKSQRCYQNAIRKVELGANVSIGNNAFQNCYSLANVTIPSGVTSIGTYAFNSCYSLASVTLPNRVTSIGNNAFYDCHSLASASLPNSVTSIGTYAFDSCYPLTCVSLPNSVTSFGMSTFYSCRSLVSVAIPSSLSPSSAMFNGCCSLASVTIPSGVTVISASMFYGCYSLASVTIPSSVTTIQNNAFYECLSITEYHILSTTPPTLNNTNAFTGILSDCKIYVPSASLSAYQTATNWSTYASYMVGE